MTSTLKTRILVHADTHFWHEPVLCGFGRPPEYTEMVIRRWRNMARETDITIHLGDVTIGRTNELKLLLDSIPGRKVLTIGNHDRKSPVWYMNNGFDFACESFILYDTVFSHKPLPELPRDCVRNIHGHLHDDGHHDGEFDLQPWHKLLAIENTNYSPVLYSKLIK